MYTYGRTCMYVCTHVYLFSYAAHGLKKYFLKTSIKKAFKEATWASQKHHPRQRVWFLQLTYDKKLRNTKPVCSYLWCLNYVVIFGTVWADGEGIRSKNSSLPTLRRRSPRRLSSVTVTISRLSGGQGHCIVQLTGLLSSVWMEPLELSRPHGSLQCILPPTRWFSSLTVSS